MQYHGGIGLDQIESGLKRLRRLGVPQEIMKNPQKLEAWLNAEDEKDRQRVAEAKAKRAAKKASKSNLPKLD